MTITFVDRYSTLGIQEPNPETCCEEHCEGTGHVPIFIKKEIEKEVYTEDEKDPIFISLWEQAEKKNPTDDGWHFVKCPACDGTGKK